MYDLWLLQITMLRKVDINLCPTEIMVNVRATLFTSLKTDKFIGNIICVSSQYHLCLTFYLSHKSIIWGLSYLEITSDLSQRLS